MKVLVTGYNGQLGYDVVKQCKLHGITALGIDKEDLDITDDQAVRCFMMEYQPTHMIHCAAYTAVDRAEDDVEVCTRVNVLGTRYIAEVCKELKIPMMYFSTDYIFDGEGTLPFEVDSVVQPKSVYGKTKYEGELEVQQRLTDYWILRISWVFGENGNNFIKTMLRLSETKTELNVVNDQIGSPTYTLDVAKLVVAMLQKESYGVYHVTNEGFTDWATFARYIFEVAKKDVVVHGIPSSEYPTKAIRPMNSRMSKQALINQGFDLLPTWQEAVKSYITLLLEEKNND
ncbi:MAG: dTDP-4-dehydrorhamnose reductase [Erysipelotrichaceae bacterium]